VFRPLLRAGVAGIGKHDFLRAVQPRRHLVDIGFVGGGPGERVHHPGGDINADMRLHPEVPLTALFGLMHFAVAALLFVLGRGRGGDDRGVGPREGGDRALPHQ
jgi:hypothetical protein